MELQETTNWESYRTEARKQQAMNNHYARATSNRGDDMRGKRFHGTPLHVATGEYIPLQHGSPDLKRNMIYPSQPSPIPAFQMPGQYSPKYIPNQDIRSSGAHMSPLSVRTNRVQDSSFMLQQDPDESVIKIGSMFPTVSDTHIRLLLKKYHNREAVVISALQVEKHPIVTPGPFATPPPAVRSGVQMTPPLGGIGRSAVSRTSSPTLRTTSTNSTYTGSPRVGEYRSSPRPHSSPKMKLRYMKSIFPNAEETIILDVLTSNDNNIQKASENLKEMGFDQKESIKMKKYAESKKEAAKADATDSAKHQTPPPPLKLKSLKEKEATKKHLQTSYNDIPEHVITIALESVHFDEDRANQILKIMVQEDNKMKENHEEKYDEKHNDGNTNNSSNLLAPTAVTTSQSRQSLKSLLKEKPECNKTTYSRVIEENNMSSNKSPNLSSTKGSNPNFAKGANEKMLLEDYIKWQGANPLLKVGSNKSLAIGPNKDLLVKKNYKPRGPNAELRKGALLGLSKGSIFSQIKIAIVGESRAK